jgi:pimeloyl-ACP methyl ester carboxylesterase/predicted glycosyltransferase
MRAREPDLADFVTRDGVKIGYEVFGEGEPAVVFTPIDAIVQSRAWKAQVPYVARNHRVVSIDPRGNGRSDRPTGPSAYGDAADVADTIAVMDATGIERAVLIGLCSSAWRALLTAALHPDRVLGVISVGTQTPRLTPPIRAYDFETLRESYTGWEMTNRHFWQQDWPGFAQFFFHQLLPEPHSTKQWEDCVGWALETDADTMLEVHEGQALTASREETEALLRSIRCPVLTIHGDQDQCQSPRRSELVAELTGGELLILEGAGHLPQARHPVVVNQAIGTFLSRFSTPAARRWTRPLNRPRRVLYLSSPIGLGHSRRDIAIAEELRAFRPDLQVDWLAQPPLTRLLDERGERVHPASRHLASEAAHIDAESAEHDLHAFQAIRRMDEILVNNFMVFADLVEDEEYDAWIGDEAWELDYFLHENPRLKRAPYVWLTDFVGWLPMPDGGPAEADLAADYNAEMVEQIARLPSIRDRALFVGDPDDIVPEMLGPALPGVREWTERNFDFVGYVSGFDPAGLSDRAALRASLGYHDDEQICVVTVGGSGAGSHLLRRAIAAYPYARALVPGLRMVVVAGPRIDPASLPAQPGVDVHAYLPNLYRHLAACDIAIVHGGLTTTMELTATRRPFIYVPLRHHFEQNIHVRHRLDRYGAGRCVEYDDADPEHLAAAIAAEIERPVTYRPVATDGARRAATRIAELV